MVTLTRAKFNPREVLPLPPLTWDEWMWGAENQRRTALVCCGNGHTGTANPAVHSIDSEGYLTPSWICPFEGCDWHEFAQLEGWALSTGDGNG